MYPRWLLFRLGSNRPDREWLLRCTGFCSHLQHKTDLRIAARFGAFAAGVARRIFLLHRCGHAIEPRPGGGARRPHAGVAELVDALDLGSSGESRGGSSPSARTSSAGGLDFRSASLRSRTRLRWAPAGTWAPAKEQRRTDHAGDGNPVRGPEARIQGGAARGDLEERLTSELAALRTRSGSTASARQGAGRASAPGLWPLGDGRRGAERRQRGEPQDRRRQQPEARARAEDRVPRGQGRGRGRWTPRATWPSRSRSRCCRLRGRRLLRPQRQEAGRRGRGRRGGRGARAHGQAEPALRRKGAEAGPRTAIAS